MLDPFGEPYEYRPHLADPHQDYTPAPTPTTPPSFTVKEEDVQQDLQHRLKALQAEIAQIQEQLSPKKEVAEKEAKTDAVAVSVVTLAPKVTLCALLVKIAKAWALVFLYWGIAFAYAAIGGAILSPVENNYTRKGAQDSLDALVPLNLTDSQTSLFCSLGACGDPANAPGGWWLCTEFLAVSMLTIAKGPPPMIHNRPARTFTVFWTLFGIPAYMVLFLVAAQELVKLIVYIKQYLSGQLAKEKSQQDMLALFDTFDDDKNGELDLMQLQAFLTEISDGKQPQWDDLQAIMQEVDKDKTKTVDREEFMQVVTLWTNYLNSTGRPPDQKLLLVCFLMLVGWCFVAAGISLGLENGRNNWNYGTAIFFTWMTMVGTGPGMYPSNTAHQVFYVVSGFISMGLLAIIGNVVVEMVVAKSKCNSRKLKSQLEEKKQLQNSGSQGKVLFRKALAAFKTFFISLVVLLVFFGVAGVILQGFEVRPHKASKQASVDAIAAAGLTPDQMQYLDDNGLVPDPSVSTWTWIGSTWYLFTVYSTLGYGAFSPANSGGQLFIVIMTVPGFVLCMYSFFSVSDFLTALIAFVLHYIQRKHHKEAEQKTKFDMSFKAIDKDGSGMISRDELKQLLQSLADGPLDETDVDYVFKTADTDKSGELNYNEVLVAVMLWHQETDSVDLSLHMWTCLTSVVLNLILFFIASGVYKAIERWDYMDAMWFNYITLSMIGYGDFFPARRGGQIFNIFAVIIGWGLTLCTIQSLWKVIGNRITDFFREQKVKAFGKDQ